MRQRRQAGSAGKQAAQASRQRRQRRTEHLKGGNRVEISGAAPSTNGSANESAPGARAGVEPAPSLVFRGVRVFDSVSGTLTGLADVRISGNLIVGISTARDPARPVDQATGPASPPDKVVTIDGGGRVLIPGLIDAHWHSAFAAISAAAAALADPGYLQLLAGANATATLRRGFTTVRDAGGPVFGLKLAIDTGIVTGPRIYPSGAFISQSGGHGDFRFPYEIPRGTFSNLSHTELQRVAAIADGADEVLRAAREQLQLGASQLKVMAGGGVASDYDPLDVTQYTEREIRAAVEAAENWGTYVMAHAYTPRAVTQAVQAGVASIEHGHLLDEATVALMGEKGVWWCLQLFLDDEDATPVEGKNLLKAQELYRGTEKAFDLARKHDVKLGWGTDILFSPTLVSRQGAQLAKLTRWFEPSEILTLATKSNAELLALSGPRNPYPGRLGVIDEGALADVVLVDGNPLEDITLLSRPDEAFTVIVKDGQVVKNTLT
jgi:imidazolonepropionase-like amidohydrolase